MQRSASIMGAVELLLQQHREIDRLFERFDGARRSAEREEIFGELAARLVAHDEIERDIFYPACERFLGRSEPLIEGLVEHGLIAFTLFRAERQRGTDSFEYLVRVLEELVQHHAGEEEAELFGEASRQMGDDMLDALGKAMVERYAVVMERDPAVVVRRRVETLITSRAPSRPVARSRKLVRVASTKKAHPRAKRTIVRRP